MTHSGKSKLDKKWLVLAVTTSFVVLYLFANPEKWAVPLGGLAYERPLYPFLDMKGRMAAMEAYSMGLDIYHNPNPLDPLGRVSSKPSYPLHLGKIGLNLDYAIPLGIFTVCSFLAVTLLWLRPRQWAQVIYATLVVISPPVLLGIERANDDLVLYCLLFAVPLLLERRKTLCIGAAWLMIVLLTPVKYYPIALMILFVHTSLSFRVLFWLYAGAILAISTHTFLTLDEFLFLRNRMPNPQTIHSVGSPIIFRLIDSDPGIERMIRYASFVCIGLVALLILARPVKLPIEADSLKKRYYLFGASIFTFCFVLIGNWDYRMIYLLPCIPLLWKLASSPDNERFLRLLALLQLAAMPLIFYAERVAILVTPTLFPVETSQTILRNIIILKQLGTWVIVATTVWIATAMLAPNILRLINEVAPRFFRHPHSESLCKEPH